MPFEHEESTTLPRKMPFARGPAVILKFLVPRLLTLFQNDLFVQLLRTGQQLHKDVAGGKMLKYS